MSTPSYDGSVNIEREKANLLLLVKLTLNTLIDQASSAIARSTFDDRNTDVTNFIVTLERILSFRMRGTWLMGRPYFWDFIRPACIGSCRQSIIERVEEVTDSRNWKDKGRVWVKFALMEKKLSELLKLVISDCHLVRKFYHDDSIMTSSQAFIICDQLAALNTIDFSFCFKHDGPIIAPIMMNDSEIDVIDLTPFLSYRSKQTQQSLRDQNSNEENKQPSSATESKPTESSPHYGTISVEKYKLEVEQRKYFEELLRYRDRELQQLKMRYETLQGERESEIVQMENIILELQLELRAARDEVDLRRKKTPHTGSTTPPKTLSHSDSQKSNSPVTPTNETKPRSIEVVGDGKQTSSNNSVDISSIHSTTTTNTDDDQYELARRLSAHAHHNSNDPSNEMKSLSSPEMISSATSLSTPSSSGEDEQEGSNSNDNRSA